MRRVRYSVAMSLDGFIAGPQGEYDWIPNEPAIDWGTFMTRFDTVLMGRRSYEATLAASGGSALPAMTTEPCRCQLRSPYGSCSSSNAVQISWACWSMKS
jgi:hypothetical protein